MATNAVVLCDIKEQLLPDFKQFRDFLRMVLPKSEDDKKLINLFADMLTEMITDIEQAESLYDLKDWFNLQDMVSDWDTIRSNIVSKYSTDVVNFMHLISESYNEGIPRLGDD